MKIKRTKRRTIEDGTEEITVTHTALVPSWLAPENCSCCHFEFKRDETAMALRLATGEVLHIHQDCQSRILA